MSEHHATVPIYLTTEVARGVTKREIMGYHCSCGYRPTGGYPPDQAVKVAQHINAVLAEAERAYCIEELGFTEEEMDHFTAQQTPPEQASAETIPSSDGVRSPGEPSHPSTRQQTTWPGAIW